MSSGSAGSRPRIERCSAAAISCGSRCERTTIQVSLEGCCRKEKNIAGLWSSVRVWYLPSSTTPTTSARCAAPELEVPADCLVDGAENLAGKFAIDHRDDGSLVIVVHGEGPAGEQVRSRRRGSNRVRR